MDKGTLIRTILLLLALINQVTGTTIIAISDEELTNIINASYLVGSTLFTVITSLVAWFKNNYVTKKGMAQKRTIERNGLK